MGIESDLLAAGGPQLTPDIAIGAEPSAAVDELVVPLVNGLSNSSGEVTSVVPNIGGIQSFEVGVSAKGAVGVTAKKANAHQYQPQLQAGPLHVDAVGAENPSQFQPTRFKTRRYPRKIVPTGSKATVGVASLCLLTMAVTGCSHPNTALSPGSSTPASSTSTPSAGGPSAPATAGRGVTPSARSSSPLPAIPLAQSVTFVSPSQVWVLAAATCGQVICTVVLHSRDRGQHWTKLAELPTSLKEVSKIRFADPLNGWAFSPQLWATHDGGIHWHKVELSTPVVALEAAGSTAWAVGEPCFESAAAECGTPGTLFRTTPAKDEWKPVGGLALAAARNPPRLVVQQEAVYLLLDGNPPYILGAADGIHFSQLSAPCSSHPGEPEFEPVGLAASTPHDIAVLCGDGVAAGSERKQVTLSGDSGHTFRRLANPPISGDAGDIAAATPTTLMVTAVSGGSWIYRTAGQDTSWTTSFFAGDGGIGWDDLGFTDPRHGVVVYGSAARFLTVMPNPPPNVGTVYLTDDGGVMWHAVNLGG